MILAILPSTHPPIPSDAASGRSEFLHLQQEAALADDETLVRLWCS